MYHLESENLNQGAACGYFSIPQLVDASHGRISGDSFRSENVRITLQGRLLGPGHMETKSFQVRVDSLGMFSQALDPGVYRAIASYETGYGSGIRPYCNADIYNIIVLPGMTSEVYFDVIMPCGVSLTEGGNINRETAFEWKSVF